MLPQIAMKKRPGHPDHETMTYWIESRIPEDDIREEYFIRRTLDESNGAKNILMLLGDLHVDAVCEKLRRRGYIVAVNHELFRENGGNDISFAFITSATKARY
jgi:hypothetical protein